MCVCVTGDGEGVRGAMPHSLLTVAGEEEAEAPPPGNECGKKKRHLKRHLTWEEAEEFSSDQHLERLANQTRAITPPPPPPHGGSREVDALAPQDKEP